MSKFNIAKAKAHFSELVQKAMLGEKVSIGKLKIPGPVSRFFPRELHIHDFEQLDIGLRAICRVESLPLHHRDPFDRLLIAQALEEKLPVVTADPVFRKYGVKIGRAHV